MVIFIAGFESYEDQIDESDYLELEELPDTDEPVYILGRQYDIKTGWYCKWRESIALYAGMETCS